MFKVNELLRATGGSLVRGKLDTALKGVSTDSRSLCGDEVFIAIKGEHFDGHLFIAEAVKKGARCIIKEKGRASVAPAQAAVIEVKDTVKALGDIAHWHRRKFAIPLIAVTGSNGKTTTKEMLAWVLSKRINVLKNAGTFNNHIGVPQALLRIRGEHKIAVLELGTNHPGEIAYLAKMCEPTVGIITNIAASHLEFLGNLSGVFEEKRDLIASLRRPAISVLNGDDYFLRRLLRSDNKTLRLSFGIERRCDITARKVRSGARGTSFVVNNKHLFSVRGIGVHNVYNALAAVAVARLFSFSYEEISRRLRSFDFPKSRFTLTRCMNATLIDDSYNANPLSFERALEAFDSIRSNGRKIMVMGDMFELGRHEDKFHRQVGRRVAQVCDMLVAVGVRSRSAARQALLCGLGRGNVFTCATAQEAREILLEKIAPTEHDVVLVKGSRAMKMEEVFNGK